MQNILKIMILGLCLQTLTSFAQTNANYILTSNRVSLSGSNTAINSTLTKTGNSLTWTQHVNGQNNTTAFTIDSTAGYWDITNSQGALTHILNKKDYTLSFRLTGTNAGLTALLSIHKNGETDTQNYSFTITGITYQ